jgi:hypothetical protein
VTGALDEGGGVASYSNMDPQLADVFARGSCVCGEGAQLSGTSQAAPVAAVAARMVSDAFPTYGPACVKWKLIASSDVLPDVLTTPRPGASPQAIPPAVGGRVNLLRALERRPSVLSSGSWRMAESVRLTGWPDDILGSPILDDGRGRTLRLRRVACKQGEPSGAVCFDRWRLMTGKDRRPLSSGATATFVTSTGPFTLDAKEIDDLILPLEYKVVNGTISPSHGTVW